MFYVYAREDKYIVEWRELNKIIPLGTYKTYEESQQVCDRYWDEVVFPERKLSLAKYRN